MGVFEIAEEALRMHRAAFGDDPLLAEMLDAHHGRPGRRDGLGA